MQGQRALAILSGPCAHKVLLGSHSLGHPGQRPQKQQTEQTHVPSPHQPWQHQSYPESPALHCRPAQALRKVSIPLSGVKPGAVGHPCHHPKRMRQEDWESSPGYTQRAYLNKLKTKIAEVGWGAEAQGLQEAAMELPRQ